MTTVRPPNALLLQLQRSPGSVRAVRRSRRRHRCAVRSGRQNRRGRHRGCFQQRLLVTAVPLGGRVAEVAAAPVGGVPRDVRRDGPLRGDVARVGGLFDQGKFLLLLLLRGFFVEVVVKVGGELELGVLSGQVVLVVLLALEHLLDVHAAFALEPVDDLQVAGQRTERALAGRVLALGDRDDRRSACRLVRYDARVLFGERAVPRRSLALVNVRVGVHVVRFPSVRVTLVVR
uniref:(northern house mosquito) hypothetical protein n=1 Tax=Culex pipiens TaxID=7175 RepID=A0A8D8JCB8_CULPI